VRPEEVRALLWSFAYFFCLLASYYILRPLRDEMGVAGGVRNLQWLFTGTFLAMLAAVPLYGALVARLPRRWFIPFVYHFFVANLAIFWILLALDFERQNVARVFFIWISVFNLFAVSVFWSFMADQFSSEQGKRLYGFIAAGGSAGALAGPAITIGLAKVIGVVHLIVVAAALLELAVVCAARLEPKQQVAQQSTVSLGGGALDGLKMVVRSPYIAGITLWVALLSGVATFLYFKQAAIVAATSDDPAVRTRIFATVDLAVGDQFQKHSYPFAIMVNATGKRFVDEGADFRNYTYAKYGRVILEQPGQFAWQIFDQKVKHLQRDEYRIRQITKVTADTVEELAKKLEGVNAEEFLKTIAEWNKAVRQDVPFNPNVKDGRRTDGLAINKSNWANTIDTPPFEGYAVTCGITFTFGGLRVNTDCEVLNTDYQPIRGLYAAGELVGGIFYFNYPGGSGLISGAVFGKIAGTSAGRALKN